jgi:hypothetical protein
MKKNITAIEALHASPLFNIVRKINETGFSEQIEVCNPDDIGFYNKVYIVNLSEVNDFVVVASNEQDAFDEAIDYANEMGYEGLIATYQQLIDDDYTDEQINEFPCGGNEGWYVPSHNTRIKFLIRVES